ncbi:MAG: AAA family ATPase [Candidatus Electrothrix sp. YB6]
MHASSSCPFVAGPKITDPGLFVGRKEELRFLARRMSGAQPVSVNVIGERRIGKSSLLYHFFQTWEQRVNNPARFVVVYIDLQEDDPPTEADFYRLLAGALDRPAVAQIGPLRSALSPLPGTHKDFSKLLDAFAAQDLLPVFCLDEFEKLLKRQEQFTDSFFDRLRGFMNANRLMLIPASRKSLDVCAGEHQLTSAFFNLGHVLKLGELTEEEAEKLVCLPAHAPPALEPKDQRLARKWGGRHPYLLQLAATALFETRQFGKKTKWARKLFEEQRCRIRPVSVWKRYAGWILKIFPKLPKHATDCKPIMSCVLVLVVVLAVGYAWWSGQLPVKDILDFLSKLVK